MRKCRYNFQVIYKDRFTNCISGLNIHFDFKLNEKTFNFNITVHMLRIESVVQLIYFNFQTNIQYVVDFQ